MITRYIILRDLAQARTASPFETAPSPMPPQVAAATEPHIESVELSKREVRDIVRDPEVRAVAPAMPTTLIRPIENPADTKAEAEAATSRVTWGVEAVGATTSGRTGSGVVVAVLDTGIDANHPAFTGITLVQQDFSASGNGDKESHGTHCAGTIFGRDVNDTRIGVATGVTTALVGKVLNDQGTGNTAALLDGIVWALRSGAHVISMSTTFDFSTVVRQRVDSGMPADLATAVALEGYRANVRLFDEVMRLIAAWEPFQHGVLVVAAAGNQSQRQIDPSYEIGVAPPGAAQGAISVGALQRPDSPNGLLVAPFSNTFPQICAPGVGIASAVPGGGLSAKSGTSMATPHVAGVAALWWEEAMASQPATATVVTARLLANATAAPLAADVHIADRGVGIVRAP